MKTLKELAEAKKVILFEDDNDRKEFLKWYLANGGSKIYGRDKSLDHDFKNAQLWIGHKNRILYNKIILTEGEGEGVTWKFLNLNKSNKIKLLLQNRFKLNNGDKIYRVHIYKDYNYITISSGKYIEIGVAWGERYKNTFKDVKPILDILNIEIIKEKYKIEVEGEYNEEQIAELEKLGVKFKKERV